MKKSLKTIFIVFVLCFFFIVSANAAYIVDTGEPPYLGQWKVADDQWLAGQITLDQAYTITDIEGYFRGDGGTLTMVVYGDTTLGSFNYPDISNEYFDAQITIGNHPGSNQWYSLTGLSLNLSGGDYWVAFEVRSGDTYAGSVSIYVPHPLKLYVHNEGAGTDYEYPGGTFPLRIQGNAVPIPGTIWLMCSGFAGLIGLRKRFWK